jgi:putative acetyltransferase
MHIIRQETAQDASVISSLITEAFNDHPHSNQTEAQIVNSLRTDSALIISLVAEINKTLVGHIAFSQILINDKFCGWYGLAPVSVSPKFQQQGVGSALILEGLKQLKVLGAKGCVLLGEPEYYSRFNFNTCDKLTFEGAPAEYFLAQPFTDVIPAGRVTYHPAFGC